MEKDVINRSDLIKVMATKHDLSPVDAETLVKVILDKMSSSLSQGNRIEIRGFEVLSYDTEPQKHGIPKQGKQCKLKEDMPVHFKPGKEMRERVNK